MRSVPCEVSTAPEVEYTDVAPGVNTPERPSMRVMPRRGGGCGGGQPDHLLVHADADHPARGTRDLRGDEADLAAAAAQIEDRVALADFVNQSADVNENFLACG